MPEKSDLPQGTLHALYRSFSTPLPFPSLPFLGLPYYHFLGTSYFF